MAETMVVLHEDGELGPYVLIPAQCSWSHLTVLIKDMMKSSKVVGRVIVVDAIGALHKSLFHVGALELRDQDQA